MSGTRDDPIDVAVIGAGIIGITAAYFLQDDQKSVVLVDRAGPAEATSAGNAGALAFTDVLPLASPGILRKAPFWLLDPLGPLSIRPAYALKIAPWLMRFWEASRPAAFEASTRAQVALMRVARNEMNLLVDSAGMTEMVRSDGCLEVYEGAGQWQAALPGWQARQREGIVFRHVQRDGIDALQKGLAPRFTHGTFVPEWQSVSDPREFALALYDRVTKRGGTFRRGVVEAVEPAGDTILVRFQGGATLHAREAVIAAGAWSKPLAEKLGDDVPLETERGYNTTLPPGAFDLKRQIVFGGHGFVVSALSTGIRVGGAVELGGLDLPPNFRRAKAMLDKAKAFLPGLQTEGGREWMGFRPSMPDSLPVIGRSKVSARIVYAFGHGHLGLTQSAGTGRLVADLLAHRMPAIPLEAFRPDRFAGSRPASSQLPQSPRKA
ncbi:D-amino-acid dehydrogenase [Aureimonas sp. SA4125]|uniref:NAD(P)/FAD-dependent oxidoreductase n=1 Tax=Aureimonas sp. SA4125 TaxID=2826993 RepID=UPI001CC42E12|nr:FAD-dependent oxidoreductase [Aureimonas sp. SA4125]BDA85252.1 D-amino-acid dehydrogenase [Aureimonas sp. SA4125]